MKPSYIVLSLIALAGPMFAQLLEIRSFRVKGEQLPNDRIVELLNANAIGVERAIEATIKDGEFSEDHTHGLKYVSEYAADGTIEKLGTHRVGCLLSGTVKHKNGMLDVTFLYRYSWKEGDIVVDQKDGNHTVTPDIALTETHTSVSLLEQDEGRWMVLPSLPAGGKLMDYLAIRILQDPESGKR